MNMCLIEWVRNASTASSKHSITLKYLGSHPNTESVYICTTVPVIIRFLEFPHYVVRILTTDPLMNVSKHLSRAPFTQTH